MTIHKNLEGSKLTVALEGRLDTTTAPQMEKEMETSLTGVKELVVDMKDLEYLSSAGLRVLLATHKHMAKQGSMVVCNVNEVIMEVFEVTGFNNILTIK